MRIKLDTGGISPQYEYLGIGVYASKMQQSLPKLVDIVKQGQDLTHYLVFKLFQPRPLLSSAVVTVHDLIPLKYPQAYPSGIRGRIGWWQNKKNLRYAEGIITDSEASKRDIVQFTGVKEDKIFVVYLAASEIFKPYSVKNKFNLPIKFVLYVGDLNWNKNVVNLAKTCLGLNYPLVIVGRQAIEENYDHQHIENRDLVEFQKIANANPKKIIRLGAISDQDLAGVYSRATVYCQPSRDEGFGLPVLEAMACGCPVLSSGKGSLPEITGKASLIFTAANLKKVWKNISLRQRLATAGLKQAHQFSWDNTIRETVKVYEKVIADSAHH